MTTENRIALITGASRGLGKAAAIALAKTGTHVIATARTIGALEELDDEIKANGGSATLVQMDLADRPAMANLAQAIQDRWGRLDVMIANAGVLGVLTPASHLDEKVWDDVIDTNLSLAEYEGRFRALSAIYRQSSCCSPYLQTPFDNIFLCFC